MSGSPKNIVNLLLPSFYILVIGHDDGNKTVAPKLFF